MLGGWPFEAEDDVELDRLAFAQALVPFDRRVVNEAIRLSVRARDESEAFGIAEALYDSGPTHSRVLEMMVLACLRTLTPVVRSNEN